MIDVHAGLFPSRLPPRLTAVSAAIQIRVDRINRVRPIGVDEDLLVIRGPATAIPITSCFCRSGGRTPGAPGALSTSSTLSTHGTRRTRVAPATLARGTLGTAGTPSSSSIRHHPSDARPRRTCIVGTIETRLVDDRSWRRVNHSHSAETATPSRCLCADQGIHAFGIPRIDTERDPTHVVFRQAVGELRPRLAGVRGLEDPAFGTATDHLSNGSTALIRRHVQNVRILDIEHDVADTGVGADRQDRVPCRSAVGSLVKPAIAASRPEWALRGNIDDVRIARVDDDLADVLR